MRLRRDLFAMLVLLALTPHEARAQRALLIEARGLAYDANYRNDQDGLKSAIASMEPLANGADRAYARYYLSWAHGALAAARLFGNDRATALESARQALEHARGALAERPTDPEFHVALANALVAVMILDRSRFADTYPEFTRVRQRALDLGPKNARVVLMDAGFLFNDPSQKDGHARGIARVQEAVRLFEAESDERAVDPLAPRWGYAAAYSMLANFYTRLASPRLAEARSAAETALRIRPDFWFVREQVLPAIER